MKFKTVSSHHSRRPKGVGGAIEPGRTSGRRDHDIERSTLRAGPRSPRETALMPRPNGKGPESGGTGADDGGQTLSTEDWLEVARETLIREGIGAVKIDRLAKACGVTRGGFYWRFKSRDDLLDQLLKDWRSSNTTPFLAALSGPGSHVDRFRALMRLWIEEQDFDPDYDTAVRNWALSSPKVAAVVHTVDDIRMDALKRVFVDGGYDEAEAIVRARITYFLQVGYYALGIKEAQPTRLGQAEIYYRILTGFDAMEDLLSKGGRKIPAAEKMPRRRQPPSLSEKEEA